MLATIHDTWNVLNIQHITANSKRWDYSDTLGGGHNRLEDPPTWLKVATTLEKPPTPTQGLVQETRNSTANAMGFTSFLH